MSQLEIVSMAVKKSNGEGHGNAINSSRTPVIQTTTPKTCFSLAADHASHVSSLTSEQIRDRTRYNQQECCSPTMDRVGCARNSTPWPSHSPGLHCIADRCPHTSTHCSYDCCLPSFHSYRAAEERPKRWWADMMVQLIGRHTGHNFS